MQGLLVADEMTGRIYVFRLENGAFKKTEAITTGFRTLSGVTFGPDDTLYVADGTNAYQLSLKTKRYTRFVY